MDARDFYAVLARVKSSLQPIVHLGVLIGLGLKHDRIGTNYLIDDEGADRVIERLKGYKPLRSPTRGRRKQQEAPAAN